MLDAALPDCEIERSCHDRRMMRAHGLLLLAAQLAAVPMHVRAADQALSPLVRSLFDAIGVAPEAYVQAIETCQRQATSISGVEGFITVNTGSYNCRANPPDFDMAQQKPVLIVRFQADIPVTKCVSFEQAEQYLRDHGWQRVADRPARDLLPISVGFVDGAGSTLTLEPYLRTSCLTSANLRIGAAPADR